MRILRTTIATGILILTLPWSALAGAVIDTDNDLVPDQFDNCRLVANGPNQTTNQIDSDIDGYGNRCDADYDQNCSTTAGDFGTFLASFGLNDCGERDHDGNCLISAADFGVFLAKFSGVGIANAPGPSGLVCANCNLGAPICTP